LYLKDCIDTGWVSTAGKYVEKFEHMIANFTKARHVVATSSGTAALHAIFSALNIGCDDEVIVPSFTFVGTANAVTYTGATPHFVDIERISLGLDAKKLRKHLKSITTRENAELINCKTGKRIAAIVCVHAFGHPSDLDALSDLSNEFRIPLIEDAAEALGSYYNHKHTGTFGRASILSFNGNKTITTGGGGAILTNDTTLADKLRYLTSTAKEKHQWEFIHQEIGFNYRLPNINAALGCAQMEKLPDFLIQKRKLAKAYKEAFSSIDGVNIFSEPRWAKSNYWLNFLVLETSDVSFRDKSLAALNNAGYGARPAWRPMHLLPMFKTAYRSDLSVTEDMYARIINVPSSSQLSERLPK